MSSQTLRRAVALATIILAGGAQAAWSFGTIQAPGSGQHAEHEKITRIAMKSSLMEPQTLASFAGAVGTYGAVGAPDNLRRSPSLLATDEAHCDNGDYLNIPNYPHTRAEAQAKLINCRDYMNQHLSAALAAAGQLASSSGVLAVNQAPVARAVSVGNDPLGCNWNIAASAQATAKCVALAELGLTFHAAQDFYSHTNYTDAAVVGQPMDEAQDPPGLGLSGPAPFINPGAPGAAIPAGLISGCFVSLPERVYCNFYRAFGFFNPNPKLDVSFGPDRVKHAFLNKDEGEIVVANNFVGAGDTSRGEVNNNFQHAVLAAISDSSQRWAWFERQVLATYPGARGRVILCALQADNPATSCTLQAPIGHRTATEGGLASTQIGPITLNSIVQFNGGDGVMGAEGGVRHDMEVTSAAPCSLVNELNWSGAPRAVNAIFWGQAFSWTAPQPPPPRTNTLALNACNAYVATHLGAAVEAAQSLAYVTGVLNGNQFVNAPNYAPMPPTTSIGCNFAGAASQQANAKCAVLAELGLVFHAVQDLKRQGSEAAAIADTQTQWAAFEHDVAFKYPGAQGQMILCVIETDTPNYACENNWSSAYRFYQNGPNPTLPNPPIGTKPSPFPSVIIH